MVICALYNVLLWNISFPGWHFLAFYGLYQKKFVSPAMVATFGKHYLIRINFGVEKNLVQLVQNGKIAKLNPCQS